MCLILWCTSRDSNPGPAAYAQRILPIRRWYNRLARQACLKQNNRPEWQIQVSCDICFRLLYGETPKGMLALIISKQTKNRKIFGAPPGTRTLDPLIKSQLLYQLSQRCIQKILRFFICGSPNWARTSDIMINSHALYRLSYRGMSVSYYYQ